jgi:ribosomal protein S27AE
VRTAENTDESGFKKIDDSLKKGNCPRCGKQMADVLLADYTPAKFCKGECRITLWKIEDEG